MQLHKIWIEQCEAARGIEDEFGTQEALAYLVGEKFLNYLEAAEKDSTFQAGVPAFVAEIKRLFEPWRLAECLEKAPRHQLSFGSGTAPAASRGRHWRATGPATPYHCRVPRCRVETPAVRPSGGIRRP
jgi:hypothetical protein